MNRLLSSLLFLVALCIFLTSTADAGTFEERITFGEKTTHKLSLYECGKFGNSQFGWSAYSFTGQSWSEAYAGPTWSPAKWAALSASVGVQSAGKGENPIRYASSLWVGNRFGSVYSVYERGAEASDNWWKVKAFANVAKGVKVGVFFEKDVAIAPVLELAIPKTAIAVWGAYYKSASQIGVQYKF